MISYQISNKMFLPLDFCSSLTCTVCGMLTFQSKVTKINKLQTVVLLSFCGLTCFITNSAQRPRGKTTMVPCDTEYPAFVSERTIKETTGNIECGACVRYSFS